MEIDKRFRIGYVLWKFPKEIGGISGSSGGKKTKSSKTQLEIIATVDVKISY